MQIHVSTWYIFLDFHEHSDTWTLCVLYTHWPRTNIGASTVDSCKDTNINRKILLIFFKKDLQNYICEITMPEPYWNVELWLGINYWTPKVIKCYNEEEREVYFSNLIWKRQKTDFQGHLYRYSWRIFRNLKIRVQISNRNI